MIKIQKNILDLYSVKLNHTSIYNQSVKSQVKRSNFIRLNLLNLIFLATLLYTYFNLKNHTYFFITILLYLFVLFFFEKKIFVKRTLKPIYASYFNTRYFDTFYAQQFRSEILKRYLVSNKLYSLNSIQILRQQFYGDLEDSKSPPALLILFSSIFSFLIGNAANYILRVYPFSHENKELYIYILIIFLNILAIFIVTKKSLFNIIFKNKNTYSTILDDINLLLLNYKNEP